MEAATGLYNRPRARSLSTIYQVAVTRLVPPDQHVAAMRGARGRRSCLSPSSGLCFLPHLCMRASTALRIRSNSCRWRCTRRSTPQSWTRAPTASTGDCWPRRRFSFRPMRCKSRVTTPSPWRNPPTAVCFVGTCAGAFYTYIVLRTAPGVQPVFIGKGWMSCSPLAAAPRPLLALPPSLPPSRLIPHSHTFLR